MELSGCHFPVGRGLGRPPAAIRRGNDKLILFFGDNRIELYNLEDNIGETRYLASSQPAKAARLKARMEEWMCDTKAQLPVANTNFDAYR